MKICVLGQGRGGKDSLCQIVTMVFELKYISSSEFMSKHLIFDLLKDKYGYADERECFEDRHNHRAEWFEIIQDYNKEDQSRLAKAILAENDIYCGMRCATQFEQSKHLFDVTIWVDADERVGKTEGTDSMTITKDMADIIIDNNGTLGEFEKKVIKIFELWYPKRKKLEERKKKFGEQVSMYTEKYGRDMCLNFFYYWTEHAPRGTKMKFEFQKTFDISKRLATFGRNDTKFSIAGMLRSRK